MGPVNCSATRLNISWMAVVLPRQRSALRYLLPHAQADDADLRRPEPPRVGRPQRRDVLPPLPGPAQLRYPQARREHDPVPAPPLLHERLRAADVARLAAVPGVDGAGAHAADVRREEYDVRGGPAPRPLPHGVRALPWPHVDEGGR